jgi:hypothetical protein
MGPKWGESEPETAENGENGEKPREGPKNLTKIAPCAKIILSLPVAKKRGVW